MASSHDLKEVLKEALETRGALGEIKARIRAEVFAALDDQSEAKPPISNENILIFELIREFLEFNNCKYTSSVLVSETGLSSTPLDREFLRNELNVVEDAPSRTVPLLYSLVSHYKDGNAERANRNFIQPEKDYGSRYTASKENGTSEPSAVIVKGGKL
ncbi:centrosomal protein 20-like [Physella acuta]|uniref:centrosomal protein 20-like n=1 Tax=Physella acuta TaxID=109671 RepID=UPI0027DB30D5|nr:centrosomal protein 20-like [Physella acuta]